MQDAVILANCLYDLTNLKPESITAAFLDYKEQRYAQTKKLTSISKMNALITTGQVWTLEYNTYLWSIGTHLNDKSASFFIDIV